MKIIELLDKKSISLDAAPKSKSEALDLAVDLMAESGKIKDKGRKHHRSRRRNSYSSRKRRLCRQAGTCGNGNKRWS